MTTQILPLVNDDYYYADAYRWDWCYLHGWAEELHGDDRFCCTDPKPNKPGHYRLYDSQGREHIAVLHWKSGFVSGPILMGRVYIVGDRDDAIRHCHTPQDWR